MRMYLLFVRGERGLYSVFEGKRYFPHKGSNIRAGFVRVEREIDHGNYSFVVGSNIEVTEDFFTSHEGFSTLCRYTEARMCSVDGVDLMIVGNSKRNIGYYAIIEGVVECVFSGDFLPNDILNTGSHVIDVFVGAGGLDTTINKGIICNAVGVDYERVLEKIVNTLLGCIDDFTILSSNTGIYLVRNENYAKNKIFVNIGGGIVEIHNTVLRQNISTYLKESGISILEDVINSMKKYHIRISISDSFMTDVVVKSIRFNGVNVALLPFISSNSFRLKSYPNLNEVYNIQKAFDNFESFKTHVGKYLTAKSASEYRTLNYENFQFGRYV